MQQKLCSRPMGCLPAAGLPLRCPRCGDQERFGSLASLRAHLEYRHAYHTADPPTRSYSVTGKHPEDQCGAPRWQEGSLPTHRGQQTARGAPHARAPHARSLSDSRGGCFLHAYGLQRRRTQSVGVGTQDEEEEDYADREEEEGGTAEKGEDLSRILFLNHLNLPSPLREPPPDLGTDPGPEPRSQPDPGPGPGPDLGRESGPGSVPEAPVELGDEQPFFGLEAAVRGRLAGRLAGLLRAADSTMQRRLAFVSTELAQTDTELLCERAHSQHLAQERQEAAERERSLSRQVDVAVMVIAALREQLNASENELERREREALTIQRFLEAAVRQETCGKVRIQQFIENLLKRIALAERLVEYYQETSSPAHSYCQHQQQISDHAQQRMSKSRSVGGQLFSGLHDNRSPSSSQYGGCPAFSRPSRHRDRERDREQDREQRERLSQCSKLFCRPEHRDGIWSAQRRRSAGYEV